MTSATKELAEFSQEERSIVMRLIPLIIASRFVRLLPAQDKGSYHLEILDREFCLDVDAVDSHSTQTSRVSSVSAGREWCVAIIQGDISAGFWRRGLVQIVPNAPHKDFICIYGEQKLRDDFPTLVMILP